MVINFWTNSNIWTPWINSFFHKGRDKIIWIRWMRLTFTTRSLYRCKARRWNQSHKWWCSQTSIWLHIWHHRINTVHPTQVVALTRAPSTWTSKTRVTALPSNQAVTIESTATIHICKRLPNKFKCSNTSNFRSNNSKNLMKKRQ